MCDGRQGAHSMTMREPAPRLYIQTPSFNATHNTTASDMITTFFVEHNYGIDRRDLLQRPIMLFGPGFCIIDRE